MFLFTDRSKETARRCSECLLSYAYASFTQKNFFRHLWHGLEGVGSVKPGGKAIPPANPSKAEAKKKFLEGLKAGGGITSSSSGSGSFDKTIHMANSIIDCEQNEVQSRVEYLQI